MYKDFFGFTKKPFNITPNPDFLYLSPKHKDALTFLEFGLMEDTGFVLLTGEIGMGKTTLLKHLLKGIEDNILVASIDNTNVDSTQLLNMIMHEYGLTSQNGNKAMALNTLIDFMKSQIAEDKRPLLIIDEAQNLSHEALEEVRLLSNMQWEDKMLLQIIIVGQPELKSKIDSPRMSSFSQRIAVRFHLSALTREETAQYIKHRLKTAGGKEDIFTEDAIDKIYDLSRGIPRSINLLCNEALVYGFADDISTIDASIFKERETDRGIIELEAGNEYSEAGYDDECGEVFEGVTSIGFQKLEGSLSRLESRTDSRLDNLEKIAESVQRDVVQKIWNLFLMERKRSNRILKEYTKLKEKVKALEESSADTKKDKNKARKGSKKS